MSKSDLVLSYPNRPPRIIKAGIPTGEANLLKQSLVESGKYKEEELSVRPRITGRRRR